MRRAGLGFVMAVLAVALTIAPAHALPPTHCEGVFYGIEATCMLRFGGSRLVIAGVAYGDEDPPAQIVVELLKWPASAPADLLARCDTDGGVLQVCHSETGAGPSLPSSTKLVCRITGIAEAGAFGCVSL